MLKQEPLPTHDGRPGNRGSLVNFASQLGIVGRPAAGKSMITFFLVWMWMMIMVLAAYCASKAAVISMTQCDAIDVSWFHMFILTRIAATGTLCVFRPAKYHVSSAWTRVLAYRLILIIATRSVLRTRVEHKLMMRVSSVLQR